jgi:ribosome-associated protein
VSDESVTPEQEDPNAEPEIDTSFDTERAAVRSRSAEAIAESRDNAILCAQIADEYRSRDIVVLDLTDVTPIVDFFVIATGSTRRQMHAVAEEVDRILNERGSSRVGLEGYRESSWILQDYGDVCLHVFTEEMRKLYDLERLWADAPRIQWRAEPDEPSTTEE